ncbi:MAG: hypothetical protein HY558_01400 [Euryarchaeota archaeon]|nr:hypothetical protein [Euryarchaeota archaeon]
MAPPRDFGGLFDLAVSTLQRRRAPYMLVGAVGVFVWGEPRFSRDVDIVLNARRPEADRVIADLRAAGLAGPRPGEVVRHALFRVPGSPQRLMVDLWLQRTPGMLPFIPREEQPVFRRWMRYDQAAFERRVRVAYGRRRVWVARPEDILIPKVDFSRGGPARYAKDGADICAILQVQGGSIDRRYVVRWLRYLGLYPHFQAIERECIPKSER